MAGQRTIRRTVHCAGIGLHSGRKVTVSLKPAPADHGIRFRRLDLGGEEIHATVGHLSERQQLQTGLVQNYALLMLVGVFAFVSMYLFLR